MINQELKDISAQLKHKQQLYLNALILGKSEAEARREAGYKKEPKSELLKEAISILQETNLEQALTEREKAIKFNQKLLSKLEGIYDSLGFLNFEKCEPTAVIREMRQVQAEISKLQGLYIEKEEEKEGITKEEEKVLMESVLEKCKNSI
jgi:hypothetical protein